MIQYRVSIRCGLTGRTLASLIRPVAADAQIVAIRLQAQLGAVHSIFWTVEQVVI